MAKEPEWQAKAGLYLGEISALALLPLPSHLCSSFPLLLVGTGSQVLVYNVETRRLLCSFHAFHGIRVHGLAVRGASNTSGGDVVAVYGERRVKLLRVLVCGEVDQRCVKMDVSCGLPRFDHWVLDALFIEDGRCLGVGLSDNSVAVWDVVGSTLLFRVTSPERCLLYSLRLWGEDIEELHVASGTIYNEIIVWKLVSKTQHSVDKSFLFAQPDCNDILLFNQEFVAMNLSVLIGHNGSIFRLAWSSDGSQLLSVSDDRSARVWLIKRETQGRDTSLMLPTKQFLNSLALFGHDARIWDCHISNSVVVTAGEDCTCRIWGLDGVQIMMFKEHIGRGIWRCLYDPITSLLVTAGFDSAIQVHLLPTLSNNTLEQNWVSMDSDDVTEVFTFCIPNLQAKLDLTDSKSEYVRCLHLRHQDILYVATNNGYLYHAKLSNPVDVRWTQLARICGEVPIVCMDLMPLSLSDVYTDSGDIIALGDGKGNATVVKVVEVASIPKVIMSFTWLAERERQLLGIHWCKSLGSSYLFTADPRGTLRLWKVEDALNSVADANKTEVFVSSVAVFSSCFGMRILCLDALVKEELLVCGDIRGNLVIFPMSNIISTSDVAQLEGLPSLTHFKGAHGISNVTSIMISGLNAKLVDFRTTGGDGCICYFSYDRNSHALEFLGMKHVKELSIIQGIIDYSSSTEDLEQRHCAVGFASTDFIVWNLLNESKILRVSCGGWRRPYSYYLGHNPEMQNVFVFFKDHKIHVQRLWVSDSYGQQFPRILQMQCHGREIHTSRFISLPTRSESCHLKNLWVATGSEDGTVRLTRYMPSHLENWSASILLGEHVGGSAVRSLCFISVMHTYRTSQRCLSDGTSINDSMLNNVENKYLLVSVGAKQVLTSWLLKDRVSGNIVKTSVEGPSNGSTSASIEEHPSISFQWLSTHIPPKVSRACKSQKIRLKACKNSRSSDVSTHLTGATNGQNESMVVDEHDNDWRYLAVTAFLVESTNYGSKVCFVVVACSDATLTLRALLLPQRLWLDVALLVSQVSPVLTLQHIVVPLHQDTKCNPEVGNVYIVVSGSTDGTITLWDLTERVEQFMQAIPMLGPEKNIGCQGRPRTGRGSQGGRWWKSVNSYSFNGAERCRPNLYDESELNSEQSCETSSKLCGQNVSTSDHAIKFENIQIRRESSLCCQSSLPKANIFSKEIWELQPLRVLQSVHQSGVNCLHVSKMAQKDDLRIGSVYCVLSGGDDQALNCFFFDLTLERSVSESSSTQPIINLMQEVKVSPSPISCSRTDASPGPECAKRCFHQSVDNYQLRILHHFKVDSAHSSAVKGVWTDGTWVFSTGLDQRIRFWQITDGKLEEHSHLIISVPEPESLDAIKYGRSSTKYQIVVTGRGMQIVDFSGVGVAQLPGCE